MSTTAVMGLLKRCICRFLRACLVLSKSTPAPLSSSELLSLQLSALDGCGTAAAGSALSRREAWQRSRTALRGQAMGLPGMHHPQFVTRRTVQPGWHRLSIMMLKAVAACARRCSVRPAVSIQFEKEQKCFEEHTTQNWQQSPLSSDRQTACPLRSAGPCLLACRSRLDACC